MTGTLRRAENQSIGGVGGSSTLDRRRRWPRRHGTTIIALPLFNALNSTDLLVGVGRVLRMTADADGRLEDYQRSQVLSALSVTRLLASEQRAAAELLATTKAELDHVLAADDRPVAASARASIGAAADGIAIGDALCEVLRDLPPDDPTRQAMHRVLRRMVDAEVAALASPV